MEMKTVAIVMTVSGSVLWAAAAAAQPADPGGVFTAAQAAAGRAAYEQVCAECHRSDLRGTAHGTELTGVGFMNVWGGRAAAELFEHARSEMPPGAGGSLEDETYLNIAAYILQANGLAAGEQALSASMEVLIGEAPTADPADLAAAAAAPDGTQPSEAQMAGLVLAMPSAFVNGEVEGFRPVTDAMLQQPPPGDWLSWRRTLDGHGYSPLDQVTRENVSRLRVAWVLTMQAGNNQPTPLAHDGVLYLVNPNNVVQALDGATGDVIWEYRYRFPPDSLTLGGVTRSIAIYQDKVFLATYDAAIVALDARTGEPVWRTVKADYKKGFTHSSGPLVAGGVLVSGINGCERFKDDGCFITGHDPGHGGGAVAHVDHRARIRSEQRHVGRCGGDVPRRRRYVDPGQLRPAAGAVLHRYGAGEAVGRREPPDVAARRRPLHQLDDRSRSADRRHGLALPARAGRDARHGHGL